MKILHSFEELHTVRGPIVYALGTFDGIHIGHQAVIDEAHRRAQAVNGCSIVITFDRHPLSLLNPEKAPSALLQHSHKMSALETHHVDYVLELPMTKDLLAMTADQFLLAIFEDLSVKAVVVGTNFTFGAKGLGTPEYMVKAYPSIEVVTTPLIRYEWIDAPISSTVIRKAVQRGDMEMVRLLLGRPFAFTGTVIHGDQRGRTLGFPTVNFLFPPHMETPADGVYVNRIKVKDKWYGGVGNMGNNPTFENQYHRFEVHIFDFDDMIYGEEVTVEFLHFLRGEVRFDSLDSLIKQMELDKAKAKEFLENCSF